MDYKETTNRLSSSRLLKLTLIGIGILLSIKIISYLMIGWVIFLTSNTIDVEKVRVYLSIVDILNIPIATAISSIIIAVIARYGARESLQHLNKSKEE